MCNQVSRFSAAAAVALVLAAGVARGVAVVPVRAQAAAICAVLLDQAGATAPIEGATLTVTVFPQPADCDFAFSVLAPGLGEIGKSGNTVTVTIPPNPAGSAAAREAHFEIGDQVFRVVQAGVPAATRWNIGDVFVGVGSYLDFPGVYKTLAPQGSLKLVPDLLDGAGYFTNGCAVDPTEPEGNGNLFTAAWTANTLSIFDGGTHQLRDVFRFTDPSTIHPTWGVGLNTPLASLPRAVGIDPLPREAVGTPDDPATTEDEFVSPDIQGFEQVLFANNGEFYVGTQTPISDDALGLGHGYLLRFKYVPGAVAPAAKLTLTGWWKLDAGAIADRSADRLLLQSDIYADGTSYGAAGVDQFDLSSDQKTIFYTSEDDKIRRYDVSTRTQLAPIVVTTDLGNGSQPLGAKLYGIRALPTGDPDPLKAGNGSAGFLVAAGTGAVYRVNAEGHVIDRYSLAGYPFALNLTPDGQSFWTATTLLDPSQPAADGGKVYRFHIPTRTQYGPFSTPATGAYGLCVKREYVAAIGACFAMKTDGSAQLDPEGEPIPIACPTPPVCLARGVDSQGNENPECFPPGFSRPVYPPLVNNEGDSFPDPAVNRLALDFNRPGFEVLVRGLEQIPGLTDTNGVITGTVSTATCTPGPGDIPGAEKECKFTVNVQWMLKSDYDADAIDWQVSPFTWSIIHGNAAPELRNPGTTKLEVGQILPTFIPAVCATGSFMAIVDCAPTPIAMDPDQATDFVHVFTTGLPPGLVLPSLTSYGNGWHLPLAGTAPTTLGSELGEFPVTITVCDDAAVIRDSGVAIACDTSSNHTSTETFFIHVNAPPVLTVKAQHSPVGVALVSRSFCDAGPCGFSPNGNQLMYSLVTSLPAGLTLDAATGLVSGVPTTSVLNHSVTIRVTDTNGLIDEESFTWTITRPIALLVQKQTTLINGSSGYILNATGGTAGATIAYRLETSTPSWLAWDGVNTFRASPSAADAGSTVDLTVVADDGFSSVRRTFNWTVTSNRAPVCSAATVTPKLLWPPNHKLVPFSIKNVTDPDNDSVTIAITSITQNQPVNGKGDGNTGFDATGLGASSGAVRAERTGHLRVPGDGRLYFISFAATDGRGGRCDSDNRPVTIGVPHDKAQSSLPSDNGCRWDSITGRQIGPCAWLNAPVLSLANRTNYVGDTVNVQVPATDPDGTPLTYGATSLPPGLSMSSSGSITGTLTPVPGGAKSKKYTVTVNVSDGFGTVKSTFTWTVTRP